MTINWWKNGIDFIGMKFHSNENIEWHCMKIELKILKFDSNALNWIKIELKRNGIQIGTKGIENLLMTMMF